MSKLEIVKELVKTKQRNKTAAMFFEALKRRKRHTKKLDLVRFRRELKERPGFREQDYWRTVDKLQVLGVGHVDVRKQLHWSYNLKTVGKAAESGYAPLAPPPKSRKRLKAPALTDLKRVPLGFYYEGETINVSVPASWNRLAMKKFCQFLLDHVPQGDLHAGADHRE